MWTAESLRRVSSWDMVAVVVAEGVRPWYCTPRRRKTKGCERGTSAMYIFAVWISISLLCVDVRDVREVS